MSDVCIKCAGKPKDYRSERTHLTMDPQTGATIAEAHYVEPEADRDLAILYRKAGNVARRHAFFTLREASVLRTSVRLMRQYNHSWPLSGRTVFPPVWTVEARNAFYGLPR